VKHLAHDLEHLRKAILQMAAGVERAVYQATAALEERSLPLARKVIAEDAEIDAAETAVHDGCLRLLALHQPLAVDLRRVTSVLLISTDLERMGDLAVSIAERAESLARSAGPAPPPRFAAMTARTTGMVRRALDAFVADDAAAARGVIGTDAEVDADNDAIIAELVAAMKADPGKVDGCLNLFSAVRHLERIADHATNIAEDVVYLVEGRVMRHAAGRADPTPGPG
jgi:phosphate transport system protein